MANCIRPLLLGNSKWGGFADHHVRIIARRAHAVDVIFSVLSDSEIVGRYS